MMDYQQERYGGLTDPKPHPWVIAASGQVTMEYLAAIPLCERDFWLLVSHPSIPGYIKAYAAYGAGGGVDLGMVEAEGGTETVYSFSTTDGYTLEANDYLEVGGSYSGVKIGYEYSPNDGNSYYVTFGASWKKAMRWSKLLLSSPKH
jgi:hypothetical protein